MRIDRDKAVAILVDAGFKVFKLGKNLQITYDGKHVTTTRFKGNVRIKDLRYIYQLARMRGYF